MAEVLVKFYEKLLEEIPFSEEGRHAKDDLYDKTWIKLEIIVTTHKAMAEQEEVCFRREQHNKWDIAP